MTTVVGARDALRHPGSSHPRTCTTVRPTGQPPWTTGNPCTAAGRRAHRQRWWLVSNEAVYWAMYDAPRLMNKAGNPDVAGRDVLFVLAERAHADGTSSFPSPELISDVTGLDDTTVRRATRRLENSGLIERDGRRPSGAVKWRLNMSLRRADSHKDARAEKERARRAATAERTRQYRVREAAKKAAEAGVTDGVPVTSSAERVAVTVTEPVTGCSPEADVTGTVPSCDGHSVRDVTGTVPPEPRTGTTTGSGGRAAAPQTPAASTPGSGSVGGFSTAQLDLETHAPHAHRYPREAPPLCAHGKPIEPFTDGTSSCSRCRIGLAGGLSIVRGA